MLLREREDAEDLPDPVRAVVRLDVPADDANLRPRRGRATEERDGRQRRSGGAVVVVDVVMPARGPHVLAQQTPGLRIEEADVAVVPLHLQATAERPAQRAERYFSPKFFLMALTSPVPQLMRLAVHRQDR